MDFNVHIRYELNMEWFPVPNNLKLILAHYRLYLSISISAQFPLSQLRRAPLQIIFDNTIK